jgi:RimJ/RimL family protein N-acetyltransferase
MSSAIDLKNYSVIETLRNGLHVFIRALRPEDKNDFIAAVSGLTAESLRRRFFGVRRHFTEAEQDFFLNVDFINHVALIAVLNEAGQPVIAGGARYVVVKPGQAELAFAVADKYQGQGVGAALMRHLAAIARESGLQELTAEVLPENTPMLKVFERSGIHHSTTVESGNIHIVLRLT